MNNIEYVSQYNKELGAAFGSLRGSAVKGSLDTVTAELIVAASLAAVNEGGSFKVHAKRVLVAGGTPQMLRDAVMVTLGASTNFSQVVTALKWIDALANEQVK